MTDTMPTSAAKRNGQSRSPPSSFYRERAAWAAQMAVASTLPCVRDKHLAAERIWTRLAERMAAHEATTTYRQPANDL